MKLEDKLNAVKQDLLTQEINKTQMAKDLGLSRFTLINIANGRTPNPGILTVQKIADYMENKK